MKYNPFFINEKVSEINLFTKKDNADYFDDMGNARQRVETANTFAKSVKNKPSKNLTDSGVMGFSYYIKTDPNRNIHNPMETYSVESSLKKSFINKVCKSELKFTEVSESVFLKYLQFLRTEHTQWLTQAQREIR